MRQDHLIVLSLIIIFLLSFCFTYLYRIWAVRKSVLDIPNERSSHSTPTPRGGGVAIVISFYLALFFLYSNNQIEKKLLYALLPGIILAILGIIDDIKDLSPSVKFVTQFICAGISLYFLGGFQVLFDNQHLWLWSLIALIGFVWFINLFNFLDGSDGYASMEAISIVLALWAFTRMDVLLLLAFSVGGFLCWNWPKAKIFMGDVGSTTIGFIIVVIGIYLHNSNSLNFSFWILITALFWFDATITLFRRVINRETLSKAHKNHIYQRAIRGGFSHQKTALLGLGINILLLIICFAIWKKYCPFLPGFLLTLVILWSAMKYIDRKFAYKKPSGSL